MAARVAVTAPNNDALAVIPNADGSINVQIGGGAGSTNGATGQATITGTATQIIGARATRAGVIITNAGTTDVYIGFNNTVTTSTGDLLTGTAGAFVSIPYTGAVWGITGGSSETVTYLEVY